MSNDEIAMTAVDRLITLSRTLDRVRKRREFIFRQYERAVEAEAEALNEWSALFNSLPPDVQERFRADL